MRKKGIILFAGILMVLSICDHKIFATSAMEDSIPPQITDIQIDKMTVQELQRAIITVTVSDEKSGVSRYNANVQLENTLGERESVTLYSVNQDWNTVVKRNVFKGEFAIRNESSGKYHISKIQVYDNADNEATFVYDNVKKALVSAKQTVPFSKEIVVNNKFDNLDIFTFKDSGKTFTKPTVFAFTGIADEALSKKDIIYKDAEIFLICRKVGTYNSYWIQFYNKYWDAASNSYQPFPENTYKSSSEINRNTPNGIYYADNILLRTKDGEKYFRSPRFYFSVNLPKNPIVTSCGDNTTWKENSKSSLPIFFYGPLDILKEFIENIKNQQRTF